MSLLQRILHPAPTVDRDALIERGFAPVKGVVDMLFIFTPTTLSERYGKKDGGEAGGDLPPLGITYICGYLIKQGYGVGLLDGCALGLQYDEIIDIVKRKAPKSIGISSTTYALPKAVELARRLRDAFPDLLIVLGGAHANAVPLHAMEKYSFFDLVVFGEGEHTTAELLDAFRKTAYDRKSFLAAAATLQAIQGIVYRDGGKIVKTPARPDIKNLDSLPMPARQLLPREKYIPLPNQYKRTPLAHMVVIRGCPYFCTFCDQAETGARMNTAGRAVEDIKALVRDYGIKEISFWDDTMSFNKSWMREFCNLLIAENLDVIWSCYAAVNTVDLPLLKLMKKAGCWNIFYGIETGNPTLMKNIGADRKNTNADRIRGIMKDTRAAGIEVRGSFMVALPGETPELAEETIKFALELDPEYAQFSATTPYPGTKLYDEIKAGKWGKLTTEDFSEYQGWNIVFLPEGYKDKEAVRAINNAAFRRFYFRPKYILKKILATRSFEDIKRYFKGLKFLLNGFAYGPMPEDLRKKDGRN
ncbi:MAG: cobalamin B12-binding domain-containing protein [Elusimicrobia bacterium]|nr:cobalamin B12-binding domain-containing protein [Elusimicrobiota bacterium]